MREWFTLRELCDLTLPGLPTSLSAMQYRAEKEGWLLPEAKGRTWRKRHESGGGREFHLCILPMAARAKLALDALSARENAPADSGARRKEELTRDDAWAFFERQPDRKKKVAYERLAALDAVQALIAHGTPKVAAMQIVASQQGVKLSTIYAWESLARDAAPQDRVAFLIPRHAGATGPRAEYTPEALQFLRSLWLSSSQPTAEWCIGKTRQEAAAKGWTLPSDRTLSRHLKAIDPVTAAWHRKGPEAADRMFPAARRDRTALHALEMVNADGHRFDVMCAWPDGTQARPVAVVFQDIYSGKVLGWRVDRSENTDAFRLAFGDVVERHGIPDHVFVDNTLAAANKTMSGGVARRFRFTVKAEEPLGILPSLGVTVHFTRPYRGQSKPIERAFRDLASDVSRHPAFEGAYLGNSPSNKPHDAGARAVPVAEFLAVLEQGIADHNARPGRSTPACNGRSFDDTFAASYATAPIRKAAEEQRRRFLLAVESVTVRQDATIHLLGNRYHHERLAALIGERVVARFDPDRVQTPLHVCRWDGSLICIADCIADVGFADTEAAREIARQQKNRRRGRKLIAEAEKAMAAEELARRLRALATAPETPPEAKVVRPIFRTRGNAALKALPEASQDALEDAREAAEARLQEAIRLHFPAPTRRRDDD